MYKTIIVDDEIWIIEGLKKGVNWSKYGFEIAGQALNGQGALELVGELQPDVVITDIRMPDISGLEFLDRTKTISPDTIFIVISGYAEFAYVQKALNSGASAFILKPFDYKEIEEILVKVSHTLEQRQSYNEDFLEIISNENMQQSSIEKWLRMRHINEGRPAVVLSSVGKKPIFNEQKGEKIIYKTGTKEYLYIVDKKEFIVENIANSDTSEIEGIGIGSEAWNAETLKKAIEEAQLAAYEYFLIPSAACRIFYYKDIVCNELSGLLNIVEEAIRFNNLALINRVLRDINKEAAARHYTIRSIMIFYNAFVTFLDQKYGGKVEDKYMCSNAQLVQTFDNLNAMLEYLKAMLDNPIIQEYEPDEDEISKKLVSYVNNNYCEQIFAQDIAARFYLSVSLFCQLFRRETRQTFTEYVTNLRVGKACELLKNHDMPIHDIAEQVGYSDYFYFSRIFRKYTGKSPSEYRKLLV